MAKPFTVSDLVLFRGNTCIVNSISHQMGYPLLTLTNLDTGYQQRAFRYEISHVETVEIDQLMGEDFDNMPEAEVSEGPKTRRFAPVTEDELVGLEEKRTSKNTHAQTAWGVNIIQGKHDQVCLFCLHLNTLTSMWVMACQRPFDAQCWDAVKFLLKHRLYPLMVEITQQFLWLNISWRYNESDCDAWHVITINRKAKFATKLIDKIKLTRRPVSAWCELRRPWSSCLVTWWQNDAV